MLLKSVTSTAVAIALMSALSAPASAAEDGASSGDLPVSMSRIRQALKTAPKLRTASDSKTDFKVEVNETQRFQDLLDLLDLSGVGSTIPDVLFPTTATPLFSVNATGLGVSISKAVARARRERAERLAREEVRRALDEYCAAHECPSPR